MPKIRITPENPHGLSSLEKAWALEYASNGSNALKAAEVVGYKTPNDGCKNLKKPQVMAFLLEITTEKAESETKKICDARERAEFLTSVMRGEGRATYVTRDGLTTGQPDWSARLAAAKTLAQLHGDFPDKRVKLEGSLTLSSLASLASEEPLEDDPDAS